ncbi:hypothetical protein COL922a_002200 [Colletotrichum nupharicola]|nr:hypothetical protein COL922a_002200 [Colletotrichum nupharicola]
MRLVLQEVKTDEEFVPLIAALREGFANPDTAVWRLFIGDWRPDDPATWFPEGEPRWVASLLLNDFLERAVRNANRPHAFLNILFTIPEYRRRGAASLVTDWGVGRADCMGLDVYIEASEGGKPLYEKYGFEAIEESYYEVDERRLPPPRDVELRREAVKQLSPFRRWSMLRKARG